MVKIERKTYVNLISFNFFKFKTQFYGFIGSKIHQKYELSMDFQLMFLAHHSVFLPFITLAYKKMMTYRNHL
jgi:hypothetical protein